VFALTPGHGHVYPTLPLAAALRDRGHAVSYAMIDAPVLRQAIESRGHEFVVLPPTQAEQQARFAEAWAELAGLEGEELEARGLARLFVPLVEPALDPLVAHLVRWRADLVVHELTGLFGPLAAAVVGIPSVDHGTGFGFPASARGAGDAMAPMWRERGLAPDRYAGIYRHLHLDLFPPSLPDPIVATLDPAAVRPMRPIALRSDAGDAGVPLPVTGRTRVVTTLGTVFDDDPAAWDAIERAVGGLGPGVEVLRLRPGAAFVPIGDALDGARVVVSHGGAGTVLAALAAGVPLVVVPRGADQHAISAAAVAAGVAVEAPPIAEAVAAAIDKVLDGDLDGGVARLRREIESMPAPDALVDVLVDVTRREPAWRTVSSGHGSPAS